MLELNTNNFDSAIVKGKVLVDFYADWCSSCKAISPIIDGIEAERKDITVGKVNVDGNPQLASRFGVMSIPTLIVFEDGVQVKRNVGSISKAKLNEWIG
jgi:thioredoxin 1